MITKEEIKKEIETYLNSKGYNISADDEFSMTFLKKDANLNYRFIIMKSNLRQGWMSFDFDIWEGEKYTINKPTHKKYVFGSQFDEIKRLSEYKLTE